ncbi:MAG: Transcriptional regulator, HxlR family [uncultured Acetobacteraceae bacterium]|uniref:Transcriptional regulator, HxlR family n=1 Tax=uncultured Acetobacteraceae bacterium TaxID=169975 RepID=A0A6J4JR04_9PROT|nr:MAG: Transcriptional regulator, HxlR family [uncultured Acetobacteraceae bacterium]
MLPAHAPLRGVPGAAGDPPLLARGTAAEARRGWDAGQGGLPAAPGSPRTPPDTKGLDLYPVLMAIAHWGTSTWPGTGGARCCNRHQPCGRLFDPVMVCSECAAPLNAREVTVALGLRSEKREEVKAPSRGRRLKPAGLVLPD